MNRMGTVHAELPESGSAAGTDFSSAGDEEKEQGGRSFFCVVWYNKKWYENPGKYRKKRGKDPAASKEIRKEIWDEKK